MVKNYGGNKAKKIGRKFANKETNYNVRLAKLDEEKYGCVTKLYGNGRAEVKCIDNVFRMLIIRKKFKGRSRRDNNIEPGVWVLVGLRGFEVLKEGTKENCDLLEVYNNNDIEIIKESVDLPWLIFKGIGNITTNDCEMGDNSDINFTNNEQYDLLDESKDVKSASASGNGIHGDCDDDSDDSSIDIDDI